jgi:hypothetical protein
MVSPKKEHQTDDQNKYPEVRKKVRKQSTLQQRET